MWRVRVTVRSVVRSTHSSSNPNNFQLFTCLLCVALVGLQWNRLSTAPTPPALLAEFDRIVRNYSQSNSTLRKCTLYPLDPWDASIRSFIESPRPPLKCKQLQPQLVTYDRETRRLVVDKVAVICRAKRLIFAVFLHPPQLHVSRLWSQYGCR